MDQSNAIKSCIKPFLTVVYLFLSQTLFPKNLPFLSPFTAGTPAHPTQPVVAGRSNPRYFTVLFSQKING